MVERFYTCPDKVIRLGDMEYERGRGAFLLQQQGEWPQFASEQEVNSLEMYVPAAYRPKLVLEFKTFISNDSHGAIDFIVF